MAFLYSEPSDPIGTTEIVSILDMYAFSLPSETQTLQIESVVSVVATPTFNTAGGPLTQQVSVEIATITVGAEILYTLDGTDPQDPSSTPALYVAGNPIIVTTPLTIRAFARKIGMTNSATSEVVFLANSERVVTPVISPVAGVYASSQLITITSTPGATIYYTTDGTEPFALPQYIYTIPFPIATTVKAIAVKEYMQNSLVATVNYTIETVTQVATPTINPPGGIFAQPLINGVTLGVLTAGANIHYTLNGDTPTATSPVYTTAISIPSSLTLKAIGIKSGLANSSVATANFVIQVTTAPTNFVAANNATDPYGTSANLSWNMMPVEGLTGFKILYGLSSGNYTNNQAIDDPFARSYTLTGLTTNTTYFFVIQAVYGALESITTAEASCFVQDVVQPAAPTNFTATITADGKAVWLRWNNPTIDFSHVILVKNNNHVPTSITDGTVIYTGTDEQHYDRDI
jgi:hypothetical protein